MNKKNKNLDLMIIGAGPAGLSAAIYAARAKLNMILIENGIIGGQVRSSYTIENYPGFKKIEGNRLADLMQEQATDLGATIDEFDMVEKIQLNNNEKIVETSEYIYKPTVLIISTGATARKLPIPSEGKFSGKGIHYCAICDGAMYEGKTVGVIGGGNAALEEALFLTKFASKVYMIRRYDYFKGEKATLEEVENNSKIEILYNWDLVDVYGSNFVDKALIKNVKTKEEKELKLDGVFGFIGSEPKTELFKEYISLTPKGYIRTNENMETNIKGVYAAGDVREKQFRQITTAVADGTIAALAAEKYIMEKTREK
ncbi:thioredoxin-disulfide reductase [Clostridium botulinum]|uniref:Thioredoxin reductase n=1 Tax=Clostridium botulinum (strain Okra / Type B1) TaxID=498213 RepID=B1IJD7_CLOBK|nr:thioredoxin-disulfide reductase [Clostridium botulinum]EKX80849.1 thioredoxin reductase [Clostridium botulinum CFSAN001628]ACA46560.1 putative thioredoxin reductase [Clostridium botulinum B1 str. Okra]MBD5563937.1 thioredoxin-disulfide reductase [Clostridium botulinum]MBD5565759.1 thioredoxin-disulfide reductase [Clostridium botulinum]MBD5569724.1 thioredoxin-disulfide reductase [Clostridium botulinum]